MPRDKQYTEWASEADQTEDQDRLVDEVKGLFDDPEVRQRVAELIARSAHRAKKLDQ